MAGRSNRSAQAREPQDRRIRRTWFALSASFVLLAVLAVARLIADRGTPADWPVLGLVVVAGAAAALHREAVRARESALRGEAESVARILQGLSRSVSPDAIVEAIVDELDVETGADHTVVVRLQRDLQLLEATLVSRRPGVPSSTTVLPLSDLEAPLAERRAPVAVPMAVPAAAGARVSQARPGRRLVDRAARDRRASERRFGDRRRAWPALGAVASVRAFVAGEDPAASTAGAAAVVGNAAAVADRLAARVAEVYGLANTLAAPLVTGSRVVGAIVLSRRTAEPWSRVASRILAGAAIEASAALERAYSHRAAETRASTDALTGLPNRRYFDEFCGLLARRRRADDAIGILMVDIDHFKRVNDIYGHATGDEVLRAVGAAIAGAVRDDDVPARYGGEEFAILLREPTRSGALVIAERIRASVGALDLRAFRISAVSVSVGVAVSSAADQPIGALIDMADQALYSAKKAGRNRVHITA